MESSAELAKQEANWSGQQVSCIGSMLKPGRAIKHLVTPPSHVVQAARSVQSSGAPAVQTGTTVYKEL